MLPLVRAGLFLAMAQHHLGERDQAKASLAKAVEQLKKSGGLSWTEQLGLRLLRAEAEALIQEPAKPKP